MSTKKSARSSLANLPRTALPVAAALLSVSSFSHAQPPNGQAVALAPVVVSAHRFAETDSNAAIGASVLTAADMRESGVSNANEAIRVLGGSYGRQSLAGTPDFGLDLRGFGANSEQNLVIMVDGVRLSEAEQSVAVLSEIPVESIERIEIVRGGSAVLYGAGATAGTIHIITRSGSASGERGSVYAELGGFNHRELRASAAKSWGKLSIDANASTLRSDNYRDNSETKRNAATAGLQWKHADGRVGVRVASSRQDARFPGPLDLAQFIANPRQASSPLDYGSVDTDRFSAFVEQKVGAVELAAELSHREKDVRSFFDFGPGSVETLSTTTVTQFSPRARLRSTHGALKNDLVAGADFFDSSRDSDSQYLPSASSQKSKAVYFRNEVTLDKTRFVAGARREIFDIDSNQGATQLYAVTQGLTAWDLQVQQDLRAGVTAFAKAGRSYRVANVDDNHATPVLNQPLAPQTSRDLELGMHFVSGAHKLTLRGFRHTLKNEIFYDPTSGGGGANTNLDPTRRQGVEVEASAPLSQDFFLTGHFQHVSAKFIEGVNAGREVTLVPKNTAQLRVNWAPGSAHSAYAGVQWSDSQRYGGDFTNQCTSKMGAITTVNARYAYRAGAWELAVAGSNLTNRKHFTNAFGPYFAGGACETGIYPDAGRQLKVSARYTF